MLINMIGSDHVKEGTNKQDIAFQVENIKVVLDGCGGGRYSEVGTILFMQYFIDNVCFLFNRKDKADKVIIPICHQFFKEMFNTYEDESGIGNYNFLNNDEIIYNNFLFTILICVETEEDFIVYSCGDGFILTLDHEGKYGMVELDPHEEYPAYYAYNFIKNKESMAAHENGVSFQIQSFSKEKYKKVGVASDGIRFVRDLHSIDRGTFNEYIVANRTGKLEMMVRRNQNPFGLYNRKGEAKDNIFKDDISICF